MDVEVDEVAALASPGHRPTLVRDADGAPHSTRRMPPVPQGSHVPRQARLATRWAVVESSGVEPRSILLVEDDPFTSGLVASALRTAGFVVHSAANAREAREKVAEVDPDAAVLDLSLGPGPNGVDLAHIIDRQYPGVALLLLTKLPDLRAAGYTMTDLPPTCGFLRKEAVSDPEQLIAAVEQALNDHVVREGRGDGPLAALTATQFAVLRAVAQGYTTPRIAEMRGTTVSAV